MQLIQFIGVIFLWIVSVFMGVKKKSPWLLIGMAALHFMETILIGVKTGVKYGKNTVYSIFMTLVFGFTWWLPLHKQIKEETFTDDDFVRRPSDNPVVKEKNKI